MLFSQVVVLGYGRVLGQDAHGPAWLAEDAFEASSTEVMLLRLWSPGIGGGAELHEAALFRPDVCRVDSYSVRHGGVHDGVAQIEGLLASLLERGVHAQHGAGGAVGAVVAALGAHVHRVARKALLLELLAPLDARLQRGDVLAGHRSRGGVWICRLYCRIHDGAHGHGVLAIHQALGRDEHPRLAFRQADNDMTSRLTRLRPSFLRHSSAHLPRCSHSLHSLAATALFQLLMAPISVDAQWSDMKPQRSFAQTSLRIIGLSPPLQLHLVNSFRCPFGHMNIVTTGFPPTCLDAPAKSIRAALRRAVPFARGARRLRALV